jgi:ribosome-binding protein aMBF1 (putative translation factor)
MSPRAVNPIGVTAADSSRRRQHKNPAYRTAQQRLAPYEGIARFVIMRRAELGLTQAQLAERMRTSHSAISRVESGQHRTSVATLERLAQALEVRFVIGFETGPVAAPVRELVSL